jgi:hypothetical protein
LQRRYVHVALGGYIKVAMAVIRFRPVFAPIIQRKEEKNFSVKWEEVKNGAGIKH